MGYKTDSKKPNDYSGLSWEFNHPLDRTTKPFGYNDFLFLGGCDE